MKDRKQLFQGCPAEREALIPLANLALRLLEWPFDIDLGRRQSGPGVSLQVEDSCEAGKSLAGWKSCDHRENNGSLQASLKFNKCLQSANPTQKLSRMPSIRVGKPNPRACLPPTLVSLAQPFASQSRIVFLSSSSLESEAKAAI